MRFKFGFMVGCAAGAWAVSKVVQLRKVGIVPGAASRSNGTGDLTAEKARAIGDLAKERLTTFLDSPAGGVAMRRFTEVVADSLSGIVTTRPARVTSR
ncbi:MAG: hypothetical protein ACRDZ5_07180 [Acidimicrobiales bacterium]